jgi:putative membrane protein
MTTSVVAITPDTGTRLAVDRTRLAYERTMMAWVRTGTSMISFGFTIYKFFQFQTEHAARTNALIGPREFGLIMIGSGLLSLLLASVQHRQSMKILRDTYGPQPRSVAGWVAGIVSVMGVAAFVSALLRG